MPSGDDFQVSVQAAEVYESEFVPALFGRWAPHLVEAAEVAPGRSVLDVACGTGVVAREAARRTRARVVGIDVNPGMLAVARRVEPGIEWLEADAVALPFADGSFDTVLCQASLMFVPEPERALGEMARVVAPGGTVGVQVWDRLAPETRQRILEDARPAMAPYRSADGRLDVPIQGYILVARPAASTTGGRAIVC